MSGVVVRLATREDVPVVVALLADDALGAARENLSDLGPYQRAFAEIDGDPNNQLFVACAPDDPRVIGVAQLSFLRQLSRRGALFAALHGVRVASDVRGRGLGEAMVRLLLAEARRRGCVSVSLVSHGSRADAHRFYRRLGFEPTHVGMKLTL